MNNFPDYAAQMNIAQTLALALPRFYQRTQLSAQMNFVYSSQTKSIEISLGFSPRVPTDEEYTILIEEITDAEKLLLDKYIVTNAVSYDNINKMIFAYKEDINQIINKQRNTIP